MTNLQQQPVDKKPSRSNRVEMPGMVWNADHVLHLALKDETSDIPKSYFQDCQGILLLNIVELGVLVSGSYGTGCLFAKDDNGKWSPPCAMGIKSVGIGSFGTAVRDLMVFMFDRKSLENLALGQGFKMETDMRATFGPLGRYTTAQPRVHSNGIDKYAAYAFTKGAFAGVTGDFGSVSPATDANNRFYKTKRKQEFTPQDILFNGVATIPKKGSATLLWDVYDKLNMLSNGETYNGNVEKPVKVSPPSVERAPTESATRSSKQSNAALKQEQKTSTNTMVTPPSLSSQKSRSTTAKSKPRSGKRAAPTPKSDDVEYDC